MVCFLCFGLSGDYGSLLAEVCWRLSGYMAGCDWLDQVKPSLLKDFDWSLGRSGNWMESKVWDALF